MNTTEEWKPIPGLEDCFASTHARIRRHDGRLAKQSQNPKGYFQVGIKRTYGVHRLVALAFIPNPMRLPQVNHINGVKTDNRIENLEWVTGSRNMLHAYQHGLTKAHPTTGAACNFSRIDERTAKAVFNSVTANKRTHQDTAMIYGISRSLVGMIVNGKRWAHLGLTSNPSLG